MKIKISELLNMEPILGKLISQDVEVSASYDLMKIVDLFAPELKLYDKARGKLFDKYGENNKEANGKVIIKSKKELYFRDLQKLLDKEIKFDSKKIKISELGKGVKLKTTEMMKIRLITEK